MSSHTRIGFSILLAYLTACNSGLNVQPNELGCVGPSCFSQPCLNQPCFDTLDLSDTSFPEPVSCDAIEANPDWELCASTETTCSGVFYDAVGCEAFCDSMGLTCVEAWDNLEGSCAPNPELDELSCDTPTGHQSDWCVCALPTDCVPDCTDKECGNDGCGGSCGDCPDSASCNQGECTADPNLDLLTELVGYGEGTTGGLGGASCVVTNLNNSGAGSLRACAEASGKKWIRFDVDGDITLNSRIEVESDKTIDGRGRYIRIFEHGLNISNASNIIITNLIFKEGNGAMTTTPSPSVTARTISGFITVPFPITAMDSLTLKRLQLTLPSLGLSSRSTTRSC